MIYFLILLFLEIFITVEIGGSIGGLLTVAEVVFSFFVGIFLIKYLRVNFIETLMFTFQNKLKKDFVRSNIIAFVGCLLLIVPGFLTDFIGLLCQFSIFDSIIIKLFKTKKTKNKKDDDEIIDIEPYDIHESISRGK